MSAADTLSSLLTTKIADSPFAAKLRLVAPKDIAHMCGCTRRKVEADIFAGKLDCVRVGGRMFATIDAVLQWFERGQRPRRRGTRDSNSEVSAKSRTQCGSRPHSSRLTPAKKTAH